MTLRERLYERRTDKSSCSPVSVLNPNRSERYGVNTPLFIWPFGATIMVSAQPPNYMAELWMSERGALFPAEDHSPPEYYSVTLYVSDCSRRAQKLYEHLAQLCLEHLPARHALSLITLDFGTGTLEKSRNQLAASDEIPAGLPAPLKELVHKISTLPDFRLSVVKSN